MSHLLGHLTAKLTVKIQSSRLRANESYQPFWFAQANHNGGYDAELPNFQLVCFKAIKVALKYN